MSAVSETPCPVCGKPLLVGQVLYAGQVHWDCRAGLRNPHVSILETQVENINKIKGVSERVKKTLADLKGMLRNE